MSGSRTMTPRCDACGKRVRPAQPAVIIMVRASGRVRGWHGAGHNPGCQAPPAEVEAAHPPGALCVRYVHRRSNPPCHVGDRRAWCASGCFAIEEG